jgi:hypothetical protein
MMAEQESGVDAAAGASRPRWLVTLQCPGTMEAEVELEAGSVEEAEQKALDMAREHDCEIEWEPADCDGDPEYYRAQIWNIQQVRP